MGDIHSCLQLTPSPRCSLMVIINFFYPLLFNWPNSQIPECTCSTMLHIPQCSIQNRNVHISVLNGAWRGMEQVHFRICEIGPLCFCYHYFLLCFILWLNNVRNDENKVVQSNFYQCLVIRLLFEHQMWSIVSFLPASNSTLSYIAMKKIIAISCIWTNFTPNYF